MKTPMICFNFQFDSFDTNYQGASRRQIRKSPTPTELGSQSGAEWQRTETGFERLLSLSNFPAVTRGGVSTWYRETPKLSVRLV